MIKESSSSKMFSILILVLGFLVNDSLQDGVASFNPFNLKLYHNLGPNNEYVSRGSISIRFNRNIVGIFNQEDSLTNDELVKLRDLCVRNQVYLIKAVRDDIVPSKSSEAFLNACSFINSGLLERLVVNLDFDGNFISLSTHSDGESCSGLDASVDVNRFNTSVFVMQTSSAPIPDTQTYIQRLEMERQEKLKGEGADNRSFFAKYWIYIVPIAILLMVSSSSNQEGEGGS